MNTSSVIAQYLKMTREPVAVIQADTCPDGALQFREDKWGCIIALLNAASKGSVAALSDRTTVCRGGKVGAGFGPFETGSIEYFLSTGEPGGRPGERYKESPELALQYIHSLPKVPTKEYLLFKPLSGITEEDKIETVIFLVNADQLSALVTLANFNKGSENTVKVEFGSGCVQSVLSSRKDAEDGLEICRIGLTDPSARKCIEKDLLSFSIPYDRFLQMEEKAPDSFLTTETWETIQKRL